MEYKSFKEILDNPIDIRNGDLTYGNYISIKNCIRNLNNEDEVKTITAIIKELYDYELQTNDFMVIVPFMEKIIADMVYWQEQEQTMLKYEPTTEEIRAGILEYSKKVGDLATVKSIAKEYAQDPDDILKWKWSKVFGILYTDLESFNFQRKYTSIISKQ